MANSWGEPNAGRHARIETIEGDPSPAALAEGNFAAEGLAGQITIRQGRAVAVVAKLKGPCDLIYFDGNPMSRSTISIKSIPCAHFLNRRRAVRETSVLDRTVRFCLFVCRSVSPSKAS